MNDVQEQTARDYDAWVTDGGPSARWMRFWFAPRRVLQMNTPIRALLQTVPLPPTARVLNIGCGAGGLLIYLRRRAKLVGPLDGIDASPRMLAWAQREIAAHGLQGSIRVVCGLATDLPFGNESFDLVMSTYVVKHLSDPSLDAMFGQVRRVLKPGGLFCFWEAAPSRWSALEWWNMKLLRLGVSVINLRTGPQLRGMLQAAGFVDIQPFGHGPYVYYPPLPRVGFLARRGEDR